MFFFSSLRKRKVRCDDARMGRALKPHCKQTIQGEALLIDSMVRN